MCVIMRSFYLMLLTCNVLQKSSCNQKMQKIVIGINLETFFILMIKNVLFPLILNICVKHDSKNYFDININSFYCKMKYTPNWKLQNQYQPLKKMREIFTEVESRTWRNLKIRFLSLAKWKSNCGSFISFNVKISSFSAQDIAYIQLALKSSNI